MLKANEVLVDVVFVMKQPTGALALSASMLWSIEANEHIVPAEMPDSVENYLNQTNVWPEWADPEKVRLGQRLFFTHEEEDAYFHAWKVIGHFMGIDHALLMVDGIAVTMIRELCGDKISDTLGLEEKDWTQYLMGPMRWMFNLADEAQDRSSFAAKISASLSRKRLEGIHNSERGGKKVTFRIPQSPQGAWGVTGSNAKSGVSDDS